MKTVMTVLLLVSLGGNVWLASWTALAPNGSAGPSNTQAATPSHAQSSPADEALNARLAALVDLEDEAQARVDAVASRYWSSDGEFELNIARAQIEAQQFVRNRLTALYGEDVTSDPAFRRIFRPLDPTFSFLTSEQQYALQRLKLDRDERLRAATQRLAVRADVRSISREASNAAQDIAREYQRQLSEILGEKASIEVLLRESPVAQQLRASTIDFSEMEFRETFVVLSNLQEAADVHVLLEARSRLRAVLGNEKFTLLWSARDPQFASILAVGKRHELSQHVILSVYEVLNDFQERRMAAVAAATNLAATEKEVRALMVEEDRRIAMLVGDKLADDFLHAARANSFVLFGPQDVR